MSLKQNYFRARVSSHLTSICLILVTFTVLQYFTIKFILKALGPQKMATGPSSSMPHEMTSPSSTLKQTKLQQTTTFKKQLPELSSNFTLKTSNSYILKIIGPGHLASIRNISKSKQPQVTRNLPHNRPVYRVSQVRPSFTGSLGSSHITTSASTSLEASFPQFELRMTSQTTTAVEPRQKILGRKIIWKENPLLLQNFAPISVFKPFFIL